MEAPALVLIRPDLTGLTMVPLVVLVLTTQLDQTVDVQDLSSRRLMMLFFSMREESWSVGLMTSWPLLIKTFSSVLVVSSN